MPLAKRHRAIASTNDRTSTQSEPRQRVSSHIVSGPRSHSTPRSSPRQRLIMECVEVVPLRKILRLRAAESRREKSGQQQRNDLDDHTSEITPERPLVPRVIRELEEKDEIGKSLSRIPSVTSCRGINAIVVQYLKHRTQC
jgi:hypothetical protein